jgi:hypothetical protein
LLQEAKAQYEAGHVSEALRLAERGLALSPGDVDLWNACGVFLRSLGQAEASLACYQRAIELVPQSAGAWSNLGNSLKDLKHYASAITCHERAVALRPDNPTSFHNLGLALAAADRNAEAVAAFNRALLLRRDDPNVRWDRALAQLHRGEFAAGWIDYEARFENGLIPKRPLPGQRWLGQRCGGKRLVITSEQGFGDTIWAARFLPRVKALGGELIMECQRELIPLLSALGVVDRFIVCGEALPSADWHCSICSLPGLFTPDKANITGTAYLPAPSALHERLAPLLAEAGARMRVGIVWSGSTTFGGNADRAVGLDRFLRAFSLPGIHLFSLQKGAPAAEVQSRKDARLTDLGPALHNFADTAAAVAAMDLIIMTDSAVAHLAGALGKPVWLLVGRPGYWLWQSDRTDSPWYASMRLFRQRVPGDWSGTFDQVTAELLTISVKNQGVLESSASPSTELRVA